MTAMLGSAKNNRKSSHIKGTSIKLAAGGR